MEGNSIARSLMCQDVGIRDLIPSYSVLGAIDLVQIIVYITRGLMVMILLSCCCTWMTCWLQALTKIESKN